MYQRSNKTSYTRRIRRAVLGAPLPSSGAALSSMASSVVPLSPAAALNPVPNAGVGAPLSAISSSASVPPKPSWKWQGEHGWKEYDQETGDVLEAYYNELLSKGWNGTGQTEPILLDHAYYGGQGGYLIDLQKGEQKKVSTGFIRAVRRFPPMIHMAVPTSSSYPPNFSVPSSAAAPRFILNPNAVAFGSSPLPLTSTPLQLNSLTNSAPATMPSTGDTKLQFFLELTTATPYKPSPNQSLSASGNHKPEDCSVCFDSLETPGEPAYTLSCSHSFHFSCISRVVKEASVECPLCRKVYGVKTGNQPKGEMEIVVHPRHSLPLEGFTCDTIEIRFSFPPGIQGPEHYHPGQQYEGTHRIAFLPDNAEGREVLALVKKAWERRLIFTVNQSITTGRENQIVWNGIHFKTHPSGGVAKHGYPDDTYFVRVKQELKDKGVF